METALREWLKSIIPSIMESLADDLTIDVLTEMSKKEGIKGPIFIDLKECGAPITAINFFLAIVENTMLMATTADIEGTPKNYKPELKFSHFFTFEEFHTAIKKEKFQDEIIDILIKQIKGGSIN